MGGLKFSVQPLSDHIVIPLFLVIASRIGSHEEKIIDQNRTVGPESRLEQIMSILRSSLAVDKPLPSQKSKTYACCIDFNDKQMQADPKK